MAIAATPKTGGRIRTKAVQTGKALVKVLAMSYNSHMVDFARSNCLLLIAH